MLKQLIQILAPFGPPVFPDDEDKTRKATYAYWTALPLLGAMILFEIATRIFGNYSALPYGDYTSTLLGMVHGCRNCPWSTG